MLNKHYQMGVATSGCGYFTSNKPDLDFLIAPLIILVSVDKVLRRLNVNNTSRATPVIIIIII